MKKYVLKNLTLSRPPEITLEETAYNSIKQAREILSGGLALESKYEILISNYSDFEKAISNCAIDHMIRRKTEYEDFLLTSINLNKALVNLLTSTYSYCEGARKFTSCLPDKELFKKRIDELLSAERSNSTEYHFMENLRNYTQHRGLPVHSITYGSHRENDKIVYSMYIASKRESFLKDRHFNKELLKKLPGSIDLKLFVRVYIECLSRVHAGVRDYIKPALQEARTTIEHFITEYWKICDKEMVGLHAICSDDDKEMDKVPLFLKWDDLRLKLVKMNPKLTNLRIRCVSDYTELT